jgi:hypothetical protein
MEKEANLNLLITDPDTHNLLRIRTYAWNDLKASTAKA